MYDLISRNEAREIIADMRGLCRNDVLCDAMAKINALPSMSAVQEPVEPNGEQYQCNKCKFYQGVHNVRGHAPCSFWGIGGVMWNDYCSRFSPFAEGR